MCQEPCPVGRGAECLCSGTAWACCLPSDFFLLPLFSSRGYWNSLPNPFMLSCIQPPNPCWLSVSAFKCPFIHLVKTCKSYTILGCLCNQTNQSISLWILCLFSRPPTPPTCFWDKPELVGLFEFAYTGFDSFLKARWADYNLKVHLTDVTVYTRKEVKSFDTFYHWDE